MSAQKNIHIDFDFNQKSILNGVIDPRSSAPISPILGQVYTDTTTQKLMFWNGASWIDLSQIITGATQVKGNITNANTNPAFPTSPSTGDIWFITTNAGTVGGLPVEIGTQLIRGDGAWFTMQKDVQDATESVSGTIKIATQAIVNAGTNDTDAVTAVKLLTFLVAAKYAKYSYNTITSLAADTPTVVTHGLSLSNQYAVITKAYQGGSEIEIQITPTSTNAVTVESRTTLANVIIMSIGG